MPLKSLISKAEFDKLADDFKAVYKQDGENYVVDVDDKDYRGRISEFRDTNIALKREVENLKQTAERFKDIDPERAREALELAKKLDTDKDAELLKAGKFDEVINKRMQTHREESEKLIKQLRTQSSTLEQENQSLKTSHKKLAIRNAVTGAISDGGYNVKKGALDDILRRAENDWDLDDKFQLKGKDLYNAKSEPMSLGEYVGKLATDAPYFFEGAGGGGAGGGNRQTNQNGNGPKVLNTNDPMVLGNNLKDIASGKVIVQAQSSNS